MRTYLCLSSFTPNSLLSLNQWWGAGRFLKIPLPLPLPAHQKKFSAPRSRSFEKFLRSPLPLPLIWEMISAPRSRSRSYFFVHLNRFNAWYQNLCSYIGNKLPIYSFWHKITAKFKQFFNFLFQNFLRSRSRSRSFFRIFSAPAPAPAHF